METMEPITTDDGFFFANEEEKSFEILTRINEGGSLIKKVTLPKSNQIAQRDIIQARRLTNDAGKFMLASVAACTKLDGKGASLDEIENLAHKDYLIVVYAFTKLSFT